MFSLFTKHSGFKEEDEWRIVFEAVGKKGTLLGKAMNINPQSQLGQFLENQTWNPVIGSYDEFLAGFREIQIDLGTLEGIARHC